MAAVLEGAGFFDWVGERLIQRARGSGHRLFHLVLAFSACLTLFLNNDGSILLGTPIVLGLVGQLRLPRRAAFAYLLGACLIASVASPPIGVSNMANLEAMSLIGITLLQHLRVVMMPALVALLCCWGLLYALFRPVLPQRLSDPVTASPPVASPPPPHRHPHAPRLRPSECPPHLVPLRRLPWTPPVPPPAPLHGRPVPAAPPSEIRSKVRTKSGSRLMWFAVGVVVAVRAGFFAASLYGVPTYLVAAAGAVLLLGASLLEGVVDARETLRQAPWPILGFAFGMDLVVFGLRNAGITMFLADALGPAIRASSVAAATLPGLLSTGISALLNNHPGLITGSLMLLDAGPLPRSVLHVAYSGVVLGADVGALLTPIGTLASLMWFHALRRDGREYSWWEYVKAAVAVVPISFLLGLGVLAGLSLIG